MSPLRKVGKIQETKIQNIYNKSVSLLQKIIFIFELFFDKINKLISYIN